MSSRPSSRSAPGDAPEALAPVGDPGAVVVGISPGSLPGRVLDVATALAAHRGQRLLLVSVVEPDPPDPRGWHSVALPSAHRSAAADKALAQARKAVIRAAPEVPLGTYLAVDRPVPGLLASLAPGDVLVLGSAGGGGPLPVVLGPVSAALARLAPCPTVLVPSRPVALLSDLAPDAVGPEGAVPEVVVLGDPEQDSLMAVARSLACGGTVQCEEATTYAVAGRPRILVVPREQAPRAPLHLPPAARQVLHEGRSAVALVPVDAA